MTFEEILGFYVCFLIGGWTFFAITPNPLIYIMGGIDFGLLFLVFARLGGMAQ